MELLWNKFLGLVLAALFIALEFFSTRRDAQKESWREREARKRSK